MSSVPSTNVSCLTTACNTPPGEDTNSDQTDGCASKKKSHPGSTSALGTAADSALVLGTAPGTASALGFVLSLGI